MSLFVDECTILQFISELADILPQFLVVMVEILGVKVGTLSAEFHDIEITVRSCRDIDHQWRQIKSDRGVQDTHIGSSRIATHKPLSPSLFQI